MKKVAVSYHSAFNISSILRFSLFIFIYPDLKNNAYVGCKNIIIFLDLEVDNCEAVNPAHMPVNRPLI